jgi:hypothetical protein
MNAIRHQKPVLCIALSGTLLYLVMGSACADSGNPSEQGRSPAGRWSRIELVDHYSFTGSLREDTNLSGIACLSEKSCLVGADEGRAVQMVELSRTAKTLKVVRTIPLLQSGKEIDIEAIAAEGDSYYIIGSHGISKKQGEQQSNRFRIFRLKVDRTTGMPAGVDAASLSGILRADAVLGEHFQMPLQQSGVNIEGLAVRNGRLFVGFRGPNLDGVAFVMEIAAADVFEGRPKPQYTLHKLRLGEGLGIREIVAAMSGFLIIAGNAGSEPSEKFTESENYEEDREYSLVFWDGKGSEVRRIGPIPDPPGKAEAMTILDESASEITALILFDGPQGGRPSVYRIR